MSRRAEQRRLARATAGGKVLSGPMKLTVETSKLLECIDRGERFAICPDGHAVIRTDDDGEVYAHIKPESFGVMTETVRMLSRVSAMWLASHPDIDAEVIASAKQDAETWREEEE